MASASTIAWAWALEAIASFEEVEASTIKDLFLQGAEISNDIGENAREMISLRILENLFDLETPITEPAFAALNPNVGFRLSDRCQDVLQMLEKQTIHGKSLQDESEKLKSDVQIFIKHKRSCLPKSALQKLKDAMLKGKNPSLASLTQRSGVVISSQFENIVHKNAGDFNRSACGVQGTSINAQGTNSGCGTFRYQPKKPNLSSRVSQPVEDVFERSPQNTTKERCEVQMDPISDHITADRCQKEMSYIATKKQDFLIAICKGRKNHSVMTYWKAANLCMKCEKGGDNLLVCSSKTCPFVFHESCLVSTITTSDTMINFYCPFCRYSRSILELQVVQMTAALARNDMLLAFRGVGTKQITKKTIKRFHIMKRKSPGLCAKKREQAKASVIYVGDEDNGVICVSDEDDGLASTAR